MKVIFLNAWHATLHDQLKEFLEQHVPDTDVFCFQEAEEPFPALAQELLRDYTEVKGHKFVTKDDDFYLATCVRKSLAIEQSGVIFEGEDQVGLATYVQLALDGKHLTICNLHGMSRPTDKSDSSGRWRQTEGLVEFCKGKGASIVGGDFNVFPTNESLHVFGKSGYRDLIKEYSVTNTRNHYVWDRYPENPRQYYSDYVFTSPEVQVSSFVAPDAEISDHLPLILEVQL